MIKSFFKKGIILFVILTSLSFSLLPSIAFAGPTGPGAFAWECEGGKQGECTFDDLIGAVQNLVDKATMLVLAFSAVVIAWAGFLYMNSGGNPGEIRKAKEVLRKVLVGLFFILAAWVIVKLIANALLDPKISTFLG